MRLHPLVELTLATALVVASTGSAALNCDDSDNDSFFATAGCGTEVDCDDTNATVHPEMTEVCDGLDNNCNDAVDEDFPDLGQICAVGVGICTNTGTIDCSESGVGTGMIHDIFPGPEPGWPTQMTVFGDLVLFRASCPEYGSELWRFDGTEIAMIADIFPGTLGGSPSQFVQSGDSMFFSAYESSAIASELWKTDGTTSGTVRVKDIHPSASSQPLGLIDIAGTLFFSADDFWNGRELWKSDGTETGTLMVHDIAAGGADSDPEWITAVGSSVFFVADDGIHGVELWKSDGTELGTSMVKDIHPGSSGSDPDRLVDVSGTLLFIADDGIHGKELWRSDGTEAGTSLVKNIRPGSLSPFPFLNRHPAVAGAVLVFGANDNEFGSTMELWRSDGTEAGTFKLLEGNRSPTDMYSAGEVVYFGGNSPGDTGHELWRTDGSIAGTWLVRDIRPGQDHSYPTQMMLAGETVFFVIQPPGADKELWRTDGSFQGTTFVSDVNPGPPPGISLQIEFQGLFYFAANDGVHGMELWRTDGTEFGTECDVSPHESEAELCDGIDNDCDGQTDEDDAVDAAIWYSDSDGDGLGNVNNAVSSCHPPEGYVADATDNCPSVFNPHQNDWDMDGEGDHCDNNDGVIHIYLAGPEFLDWTYEAPLWPNNVYSGDFDVLRQNGEYTQVPGSNPLATRHCGITATNLTELADPTPGKLAFFLVTGMVGGMESDLGRDGDGEVRPNSHPCP